MPVSTSVDDFFAGENLKNLGSLFGVLKARFGPECVKFCKEKMGGLTETVLEKFAATGVPEGCRAIVPSDCVGESLVEAFGLAESEFMGVAVRRDWADGCEFGGVLLEYSGGGAGGATQRVFVHAVGLGGVGVLACRMLCAWGGRRRGVGM